MKQNISIILSVLFGDRFFQLKGRSGLLEFWSVLSIYGILPFALLEIIDNSFGRGCLFFFIVFLQPWILWSLVVRRLHDLNLRGWWILTVVALLILPFVPGKKEQNRFDVNNK